MKIIVQSGRKQMIFRIGLFLLISNVAEIAFSVVTFKRQTQQARLVATTTNDDKSTLAATDVAGRYRDYLVEAFDICLCKHAPSMNMYHVLIFRFGRPTKLSGEPQYGLYLSGVQ